MKMKTYELTIIASGIDVEADDFEDRLFEAGCADATISVQKGVVILEFTRQAQSFLHALVTAVLCVHRAGAKVERIEPDHLVNLSDIAARTGLSKAAVSLYAKGERARNFPWPVARVTTESPLWDWVDVARWMYHQQTVDRDTVLQAKAVREANIAVITGMVPHHRLEKHLLDHHEALEAELA
jgi:hypothetical protein